MGIFTRIGSTARSLVGRLTGAGKAPKRGTTETPAQSRERREKLSDTMQGEIAEGRRRLDELLAHGQQRVKATVRGTFHPGPRLGPRVPAGLKGFLHGVPYSGFSSSNVGTIQYDATEKVLYVQYLDGRWYRYFEVSAQKATGFWYAASKGQMVWRALRVLGSRTAHQHRYEQCSGPPSYLPLEQDE